MPIRIFIDQGHNPYGVNAGAEAFGLREQDITYEVGVYLAELLNSNPNFEARLSRPTPETSLGVDNRSSLAIRVAMANEWPADYFLSIHANASENPSLNGTEVYVFNIPSEAANLAQYILDAITDIVGTRDNGVRANPSLYVLRRTAMPAALIELAYLTNYSDAMLLSEEPYTFAFAIYVGLLNYFGLPMD